MALGDGNALRNLLIVLALAGGLWPARAFGLEPAAPLDGLIHRRWDVADGLPNPAVQALAETPEGLLWVGTRAGLARFDGRVFELLAHDSINALVVDREGVLWAGTDGGGVLRYQEGGIRVFGVADGLASARVTAMALDLEGRLMVATSGGGVARREGGLFHPWIRAVELPGPVAALAVQGDRILLATASALFAHQQGRLAAVGAGLPHPRALAAGADGEVFVATDDGLLVERGGAFADPFAGRGPKGALALQAEPGGVLWIGTLHGLWRSQPRLGTLEPFLPPHPAAEAVVAGLLLDHRGQLWAGSLDDGLHQLRQNPLRTWGRREGLASDIVNALAEDRDGRIWMASRRGGGLARLDPASGRAEKVPAGLPEEDLWSVGVDPDGAFWLGSNRHGLLQGELGGRSWRGFGAAQGLPEGPVQAVRFTRDGAVWTASDGGLGRVAGGRLEVFTKADGLPSNAIRDIFEDRDGQVWIATTGGLARYLGGRNFEAFGGGSLIPEGIFGIWQDEQGALWLATVGALVQIEKGRARALTTRDGLHCDDLSCVTGDRLGNLWMGTAKGLVRVSLDELRRRLDGEPVELHQWIFDARSGLRAGISTNGGAALASRSGRLYFASRGGLIEVRPEELQPLAAPPARLEELVATPRPWWQSLTSATSGSHLLFRFATSTLASPAELRVRYRLEGFDTAWRAAGPSNLAEYRRVPPGSYRFLLETSDQQGHFVASPAAVREVSVARRWALLLLLPGLLLALAGAALALLHRLRIRWLERRKAELQRQVDEALAELQVLRGMLPICSSCKRIRDDRGYWEEMGSFLESRSGLEFEKGLCPECDAQLIRQLQTSGRVVRVVRAMPGASS